MARTILSRVLRAALLTFVTLFIAWIIAALHGVWSFGIVRDYLNDGRVPLYPSLPVTYGAFFFMALTGFLLPLVPALILLSFAPQRFVTYALSLIWLVGFLVGADNISFTFQIDFGTTWAPTEAFRALFFHPIVTPFSVGFGVLATYAITRRLPPLYPATA